MEKEKNHHRSKSEKLNVPMKPDKKSHHALMEFVKSKITSLESLKQETQTSEKNRISEVNIASLKHSHKKKGVKKSADEERQIDFAETSAVDEVRSKKVKVNAEFTPGVQDGASSKSKSRKDSFEKHIIEFVDQKETPRSSKERHASGWDANEKSSPTQRSSKLFPPKASLDTLDAKMMKRSSKSLNVNYEVGESSSSEGKKKKKKKEELLPELYPAVTEGEIDQLECAEISSKEKKKKKRLSQSRKMQDEAFQSIRERTDSPLLQNNTSKVGTPSRDKSKKKDASEVFTNSNFGMSRERDEEQTVEQDSEVVQVEDEETIKKKKKRVKSGEDQTFGADIDLVALCDLEDGSRDPSTSKKSKKRSSESQQIQPIYNEEIEDPEIQFLKGNSSKKRSLKEKSRKSYASEVNTNYNFGIAEEQKVEQESAVVQGEETTKKKKKREKSGEDQTFVASESATKYDLEDGSTDLSTSKKSKESLSEFQQRLTIHQEEKEDPDIQFLQDNKKRRSSKDKSKKSYASKDTMNSNLGIAEEQTVEQECAVVQDEETTRKRKKKKKKREKSGEDQTIGAASDLVALCDFEDGNRDPRTKKSKKRLSESQQIQLTNNEEIEDPDIQFLEHNSSKKRKSSRDKSKEKYASEVHINGKFDMSSMDMNEEPTVEPESEVQNENNEATKKKIKKMKKREKSGEDQTFGADSEGVVLCELEDRSIEPSSSKKSRKRTSREHGSMEVVEIEDKANYQNQESSNINGELFNASNPYGAQFVVTDYDKWENSQGKKLPWEKSIETSMVPVKREKKKQSRKSKQGLPNNKSNDTEKLDVSVKQECDINSELINLDKIESEETTENFSSVLCYYELKDGKIIFVLEDQSRIYFKGMLKVSTIWGSIDVLGYRMKCNSKKTHTVFSSKMHSLLCLESKGEELECDMKEAKKRLIAEGVNKAEAEQMVSSIKTKDVIVLLEKTENAQVEFLEKYWKHSLSYEEPAIESGPISEVERNLNCNLVTSGSEDGPAKVVKSSKWDMLADDLLDTSQFGRMCIVACGGKGVGKSTLLRYLINRYLGVYEEIVFLDFDPGQAEFTVPGCVSATLVNEPLLGRNFTHLRKPERMLYLGNVDVSQCPVRYIKCVEHIFNFCKSDPRLSKLPWFVNTMGFNEGMGVDLVVDIIRMANPTHLVQIRSQKESANYPFELSVPNVLFHKGNWCSISGPQEEMEYAVHHIESLTGDIRSGNTRPIEFRELVVMSYLSGMVKPPNYCMSEVTPYKIPFSSLFLSVAHETVHPEQILNVLNSNFVGLCVVDETQVDFLESEDKELPKICVNPPISPCVGFGIIRGVDVETKQLYLVTPLTAEELQPVNCLMMGVISVPPRLLLSAKKVGFVPYVSKGSSQVMTRTPVRSSRISGTIWRPCNASQKRVMSAKKLAWKFQKLARKYEDYARESRKRDKTSQKPVGTS